MQCRYQMFTCYIWENPNIQTKYIHIFVWGFGWDNKNEPKM